MNIYELIEHLKVMKTPVFTTNEIARISNLKKACAIVYIKRMIDKKLLFRVAKGFYSLQNDSFLYASYIIPNSYISFNSALYIRRAIDQIPTTIHVVVPKRVKKKVDGVTFIKMSKKALFGFSIIEYKGYHIWVAEVEKALVDIMFKFGSAPKITKKINKTKITRYAKKIGITDMEEFK
jgi:predicted transcriptional regulator of viral defense system